MWNKFDVFPLLATTGRVGLGACRGADRETFLLLSGPDRSQGCPTIRAWTLSPQVAQKHCLNEPPSALVLFALHLTKPVVRASRC
jgi:hypothetical protein